MVTGFESLQEVLDLPSFACTVAVHDFGDAVEPVACGTGVDTTTVVRELALASWCISECPLEDATLRIVPEESWE